MINLNIHAGHSLVCRGAAAELDEVEENRKVLKTLLRLFSINKNFTVYNCTDDEGKTANENLSSIVAKCNAHTVDWDISIHLNAGRNDSTGDGKTGGVEVWTYPGNDLGLCTKICNEISKTLDITNRGVKQSKDYYVLKHTKAPAMIIECCFVDDKDDKLKWDSDICAEAIYLALLNYYEIPFLRPEDYSCKNCKNFKMKG